MERVLNVEELFGENVFTIGKMREYLPKDAYKEVRKVMDEGGELSRGAADEVAKAMKEWAVQRGATHYTHWFQPLTGITAEKHDSFVSNPDEDGKMILEFSGKALIKGESDASSFPSGGLRPTFEARGYTAWDITSPAFLKETGAGITLCIPTAFYAYTGEALDKKTPLLRSMEAVSEQTVRILRLFGDKKTKKVIPCAGAEQEYFLVDKNLYLQREDLIFAGRTLFGAQPPKGQEMDDHYYGVIRERIGAYMKDVNEELWKLGVTAKTQHNEAAPGQHELASIYENCNTASDHNQIVMETMKRVAQYHDLTCLLHEKPFSGVNGSGKHDNWSLMTDSGVNLMDPGKTPHENVQFLLILACILKAVDTHADLLRQSAANVGNDHRLGALEAPPAIISVFLGQQLEDVVRQLVETGEAMTSMRGGRLVTGVSTLPDFERDATDRNRTSPFAFTGNKFEFRMVGSNDSIASANTILNTIVAEAFCEAADRLEKEKNIEAGIHNLIKEYLISHRRIIYSGNGYSDEWVREAERRGLPNIRSMVESVDALSTEKAVKLFEKFGIFTRTELESREEILYETYAKTINIEAMTMVDMASKQIIPAVILYTRQLADAVNAVKAAGVDASVQLDVLTETTDYLKQMKEALAALQRDLEKTTEIEDSKELAFFYKNIITQDMDELRMPADALEMIVDRDMWPFPTYADLLFEV